MSERRKEADVPKDFASFERDLHAKVMAGAMPRRSITHRHLNVESKSDERGWRVQSHPNVLS